MVFEVEEKYMRRCLELAENHAGYTAPNPMVGAVLVFKDRIIGEGAHEFYGGPHAEVNCFHNVLPEDEKYISNSILYVSLEPCAHFGKTPPCADLIISKGIKKVVVGIRDPFEEVNGKGIEKLQRANVEVVCSVLEKDCYDLNKRFFCFHIEQRPYIILKWAQTANGIIGNISNERLMLTNAYTNGLVHKWRSEEMAILVGTNTAVKDDPQLNVRKWQGKSPVKIVIDRELKLPGILKMFSEGRTIVLNEKKSALEENIEYINVDFDSLTDSLIKICNDRNILSVLVEGGTQTLQTFIDADCWDEARVITNENLLVETGVAAPKFSFLHKAESFKIETDRIDIYKRKQ